MNINQQNRHLSDLYFELANALAGLDLTYDINPTSKTPVTYRITIPSYLTYYGNYKECEAFISGLQTMQDIMSEVK